MPDGGELTLSAAVQQGRDDAGQAFSLVRLMVADRGSGLDDETIRHLFEPFWTTKPAGTGLGLATVYRIVEAHGGTIQAQPREGGGTVFTILLPIVEENRMKTRILVVDDELSMREFISILLEREGYEVVTAADAATALGAPGRIPG